MLVWKFGATPIGRVSGNRVFGFHGFRVYANNNNNANSVKAIKGTMV